MTVFVVPCSYKQKTLYNEIVSFIGDNAIKADLVDRDMFGMSVRPNKIMQNRWDVEVTIADDEHAVLFKMRFCEEMERDSSEQYRQQLSGMLSAQFMQGITAAQPKTLQTAVKYEDIADIAKNLGVSNNDGWFNSYLPHQDWKSGSYESSEVGRTKYRFDGYNIHPSGGVAVRIGPVS